MSNRIRFVLAIHNHQPVGNFDHVFEQAYQDSYQPFLEVFGRYDSLRMSLHTSGPLMEWLADNHPDYVDRLAELVTQGRIEIIGGPFYEPILAMIPSRDRIGQIRRYTKWLEDRLGAAIRGMWVPERVWEQSYVRDLAEAGIQYTVLDDFHFKNAGLEESQLAGHYLTEDDGRLMSVFPGSEQLRYLIPFGMPHQTIEHLGQIAQQQPNAVVVFGDDGEKFGTWPETKKHVYTDGWLERFFDALVENQDWIQTTTLSEAADSVEPLGKVYLPDSSYREMTEWVLPVEQQVEYHRLAHELEDNPSWPGLKRFIRGGFWRNFKVRYPESDEMYCRMMEVSGRLNDAIASGASGQLIDEARTALYRGQCNCAYWHGAFGGVYLPHLRNAIYGHLIDAENLLDQQSGKPANWIEARADDFDFDGRQEIKLANDKLVAHVAPSRGGQLYELDVRAICHNLLATLARRPEAYHQKIIAGSAEGGDECASIHDRVVCKQEGLDEKIRYDSHRRKSLVDMFYAEGTTLEAVEACRAEQIGDFLSAAYDARVRRNPERIQVQMFRQGMVGDLPIKLTKGLTLEAGSSTLEIAYLLEGIPQDRTLLFAPEFNFAGMPAGADDRYFHDLNHNRLGQLGERLELHEVDRLGLKDEWLGIDVALRTSCPTGFWTFPIETVSQSEGGFELVHQSVVVQPRWTVVGDAEGRWSVTMRLSLETREATNHTEDHAVAVTT